jgi:low affinity Fe/Cu permease
MKLGQRYFVGVVVVSMIMFISPFFVTFFACRSFTVRGVVWINVAFEVIWLVGFILVVTVNELRRRKRERQRAMKSRFWSHMPVSVAYGVAWVSQTRLGRAVGLIVAVIGVILWMATVFIEAVALLLFYDILRDKLWFTLRHARSMGVRQAWRYEPSVSYERKEAGRRYPKSRRGILRTVLDWALNFLTGVVIALLLVIFVLYAIPADLYDTVKQAGLALWLRVKRKDDALVKEHGAWKAARICLFG